MRIGGFQAFEKNSDGSRLWAAYHSPHSLTWRWSVRIAKRFKFTPWFGVFRHKHNCGSQTHILFVWWGLCVSTQRPMWYRDLYRKARDEKNFTPPPPAAPPVEQMPDHPTVQ